MDKHTIAGHWTEADATERQLPTEYAGECSVWTTTPGRYPIHALDGGRFQAYIDATRTFWSWNGCQKDTSPVAGRFPLHLYCFQLADAVEQGKAELAPGWELHELSSGTKSVRRCAEGVAQ